MPKMIQIRNVPDDVHRRLKVRAAQAGSSLSEYLLAQVEQILETPTIDELAERISRRRNPGRLSPPAAEVVREDRDRR